jgi:hypothetical protein
MSRVGVRRFLAEDRQPTYHKNRLRLGKAVYRNDPRRLTQWRGAAMRYVGILVLLASTFMLSQNTAKLYLIALDGSYWASVDGVRMKVEAKHYIEQKLLPGRHIIGYQSGYFGDWTATSFKVIAGQSHYSVFSSAPGSGRMCSQLSSAQGETCLSALENRRGTQECFPMRVNSLSPFLQPPPPGNLVPWGLGR